MSYIKVTLPGIAAPESAVQLDSGEYVALKVECASEPVTQMFTVHVEARQVDAGGAPVKSPSGQPVTASYSHGFILANCGLSAVECQKCALMVLLEEPITGIDAALLEANGLPVNITSDIRDAIAAAHVEPTATADLL